MKYSLINVVDDYGDTVNGYWVQNHTGDDNSVKKEIEKYNATNMMNVVAIDEVLSTTPALHYWRNLKVRVR